MECRANLVHRLVQLLSKDLIVHLDLRDDNSLVGATSNNHFCVTWDLSCLFAVKPYQPD